MANIMIKGDYMKKEPFIIDITDNQLPNLAKNSTDEFGFEFSNTNIWRDDSGDIIRILNSINEKLDIIIRHIEKNGRE